MVYGTPGTDWYVSPYGSDSFDGRYPPEQIDLALGRGPHRTPQRAMLSRGVSAATTIYIYQGTYSFADAFTSSFVSNNVSYMFLTGIGKVIFQGVVGTESLIRVQGYYNQNTTARVVTTNIHFKNFFSVLEQYSSSSLYGRVSNGYVKAYDCKFESMAGVSLATGSAGHNSSAWGGSTVFEGCQFKDISNGIYYPRYNRTYGEAANALQIENCSFYNVKSMHQTSGGWSGWTANHQMTFNVIIKNNVCKRFTNEVWPFVANPYAGTDFVSVDKNTWFDIFEFTSTEASFAEYKAISAGYGQAQADRWEDITFPDEDNFFIGINPQKTDVTVSILDVPSDPLTLKTYLTAIVTTVEINEDNTGYAASGTLFVNGEEMTYSSKPSSTTFTISGRGVNGTLAMAHEVDSVIIEIADSTTLNVTSTDGFRANGKLLIDLEVVSYRGKTDTTFTNIGRGCDITSPASHAIGSIIYCHGRQKYTGGIYGVTQGAVGWQVAVSPNINEKAFDKDNDAVVEELTEQAGGEYRITDKFSRGKLTTGVVEIAGGDLLTMARFDCAVDSTEGHNIATDTSPMQLNETTSKPVYVNGTSNGQFVGQGFLKNGETETTLGECIGISFMQSAVGSPTGNAFVELYEGQDQAGAASNVVGLGFIRDTVNLSGILDWYKDWIVIILSGTAKGDRRKIVSYDQTTSTLTLDNDLSVALGIGDTFRLFNMHDNGIATAGSLIAKSKSYDLTDVDYHRSGVALGGAQYPKLFEFDGAAAGSTFEGSVTGGAHHGGTGDLQVTALAKGQAENAFTLDITTGSSNTITWATGTLVIDMTPSDAVTTVLGYPVSGTPWASLSEALAGTLATTGGPIAMSAATVNVEGREERPTLNFDTPYVALVKTDAVYSATDYFQTHHSTVENDYDQGAGLRNADTSTENWVSYLGEQYWFVVHVTNNVHLPNRIEFKVSDSAAMPGGNPDIDDFGKVTSRVCSHFELQATLGRPNR